MNLDPEPEPRVIVRLTTSWYRTGKGGLAKRREITPLRRLCRGHNFLSEDVSMVGADCVGPTIINWDTAKNGVHELKVVNEKRDWETGMVDDWEYELVPFTP